MDRELYAKNKGYKIVGRSFSIWKTPNNLKTLDGNDDVCPKCFSKLECNYTLIPIGNEKYVKIDGKQCNKCNCLYINTPIKKIIQDNPFAKDFTLDGEILWNFSVLKRYRKKKQKEHMLRQQHAEKLSKVPSAAVMFCVKSEDVVSECIIVTDKSAANVGIYHYSDEFARELLTARFHDKKNTILYENRSYKIVSVIFPSDKHNKNIPEYIIPQSILIKNGGGYYTAIKNNYKTVVELLLYSHWTKRYEIISATYDKKEDIYYIDITKYRGFIHKYGNPGIIPDFEPIYHYGNQGYDNLKEESILMGYGYSVAEKNNLSKRQRHDILEEIVDLKILTIPQVIRMLKFFIESHTTIKDTYARIKWQEDMEHIEKYNLNEDRFLIVQN